MSAAAPVRLRLDEFAFRQFDDPAYVGTKVPMDKKAFMVELRKRIVGLNLKDGYAPFCKHLFVPNFVPGLQVGTIPITPENEHLLRSDYVARTEKELPVLTRWFPRSAVPVPDAKVIDVILYSRDQVVKETAAMGGKLADEQEEPDWNWAVISIKGQLEDFETPMSPITVMRNALGKEEGGSGVPMDRTKYLESVEYWKKNAALV